MLYNNIKISNEFYIKKDFSKRSNKKKYSIRYVLISVSEKYGVC